MDDRAKHDQRDPRPAGVVIFGRRLAARPSRRQNLLRPSRRTDREGQRRRRAPESIPTARTPATMSIAGAKVGKKPARDRQNCVADDAAKPCRQSPARRRPAGTTRAPPPVTPPMHPQEQPRPDPLEPPRRRSAASPKEPGGTMRPMTPSPSICISRSAATAPREPRRLRTGPEVAWLRLGSSTDHDNRASASATVPARRQKPANSAPRRAAKARRRLGDQGERRHAGCRSHPFHRRRKPCLRPPSPDRPRRRERREGKAANRRQISKRRLKVF